MKESEHQQQEETLQQLRLKANELLLREEWSQSIQTYSHFISLCQTRPDPKHRKSLCLAFSNRAEARSKTRDFDEALKDCDEALKIENTHLKTLMCKGKILLNQDRYNMALNCFKIANLDHPSNKDSETLNGYLEKCKKLEFLSRSGAFDISNWVLSGFKGKLPELAEYIGGVEIKKSEISGRGLVATKNIDLGSLLLVTKAVATERGIMPESKTDDLGENAQMVMWKNFVDKVVESSSNCKRTHCLISMLSSGENEESLEVPNIATFRPESEQDFGFSNEKIDMGGMLNILDVNSLVEETFASKFSGKKGDYHGVGIWLLASFINHSCNPNAKRFHIGDHVIVHASRDIKEGEEITLGYFDVFSPLKTRKEMAKNWGFDCHCKRCKFEVDISSKHEMGEIEMGYEIGVDVGTTVYKLEESMKRWMVRGKMKGYLRASFWKVYSELFVSEKLMRKWGRRVPTMEVVVDSVVEAVGGDERVLRVVVEGMKRNGGGGLVEMEKVMKLGRGVYGKVMKKQAMRSILS
ncbi:putative [histone H3]-lysine(4) N-trimethyltransferase chromatin remodeling SET family [Helianthus annuus]|nr:putative [histone H3]-lysine(4) N-trimethyltransferase chromatin remodeling SET family [Helianthus annuus]